MQGLAMSRSFGDNISKPVGVTHIPEIINLKIDKRDRFVLIASDGVWEFITNQEVLQLLVPFYRDNKLEEACDALMKLAYERWTVEDKSIVDDITLILIFFEHQKDLSVE
jgi:serine/threonine protein phosphatase PrpC